MARMKIENFESFVLSHLKCAKSH